MKNPTKIRSDSFEFLFKKNYQFLCLVSLAIVKDKDASKDIVQDFFISYWQKRNSILIKISFRAYAVKAVKNLSLIAIKKINKENSLLKDMPLIEHDYQEFIDDPNRSNKILEALEKLPLKRREIFISAVMNGHSYNEIAESRDISINTVKTQIKRSYSFLRVYLEKVDLLST